MELHTQIQELVNMNTLVQGYLRALQRNYKTNWQEAHIAYTLANDEHGRLQQSLTHINQLRDRVHKIGNQPATVTQWQNDQERFMEDLAIQVNLQEEQLVEI